MIFFAVSLAIGAFLGSVVCFWNCSLKSTLFPTKILTAEGTTSSISGNH